MLYIINCPCCGLKVTRQAPSGIIEESNLATVCCSLEFKSGAAWCSVESDLDGLAGLLCDSETLKEFGIDSSDSSKRAAIRAIYDAVYAEQIMRDILK
ncbi:MAG: hypothetical protein ACRC7P_08730 [Enterovibrio sp.]